MDPEYDSANSDLPQAQKWPTAALSQSGQVDTGSANDDLPEEHRPAQVRATNILTRNARAGKSFEDASKELSQAIPGTDTGPLKDCYDNLGPSLKLQDAHKALAHSDETASSITSRHLLPWGSELVSYRQAREHADAQGRVKDKTASDQDYQTIAAYERAQHLDQNRDLWGKLGLGVLSIPKVAGEFFVGGAIAKGLGKAGMATGRAAGIFAAAAPEAAITAAPIAMPILTKLGVGLAKASGTTAFVPAMYVEKWIHDNEANGRDPTDLKGLPAAYAMGTLQIAVLGGVGEAMGTVGGTGPAAWAARAYQGTKAGLAGQATVDVAASAISQFIPKGYKLEEGYGVPGRFVDALTGKPGAAGEAAQQLLVQAVTFAGFSAIHAGGDPHAGRAEMERFTQKMYDMQQHGLDPLRLSKAYDAMTEFLAKNPNPTRAEASKAMETLPEGPVRDYGMGVAERFPVDRPAQEVLTPEQQAAVARRTAQDQAAKAGQEAKPAQPVPEEAKPGFEPDAGSLRITDNPELNRAAPEAPKTAQETDDALSAQHLEAAKRLNAAQANENATKDLISKGMNKHAELKAAKRERIDAENEKERISKELEDHRAATIKAEAEAKAAEPAGKPGNITSDLDQTTEALGMGKAVKEVPAEPENRISQNDTPVPEPQPAKTEMSPAEASFRSVFPEAQQGVGGLIKGKTATHTITMEPGSEPNAVKLDFYKNPVPGESYKDRMTKMTQVGAKLEPGSLDVARKLRTMVKGLKEAGAKIEYVTDGHAKIYEQALARLGYRQTEGPVEEGPKPVFRAWEPISKPAEVPEPVKEAEPAKPAEPVAETKEQKAARRLEAMRRKSMGLAPVQARPSEPAIKAHGDPETARRSEANLDAAEARLKAGEKIPLPEVFEAADLTPFEREIVERIASGQTMDAVAAAMGKNSKQALDYHVNKIEAKMGLPESVFETLQPKFAEDRAAHAQEMAESGHGPENVSPDELHVSDEEQARQRDERQQNARDALSDQILRENKRGKLSAERRAYYARAIAAIEAGEPFKPGGKSKGLRGDKAAGRVASEQASVQHPPGIGVQDSGKAPGPTDAVQAAEPPAPTHPEDSVATGRDSEASGHELTWKRTATKFSGNSFVDAKGRSHTISTEEVGKLVPMVELTVRDSDGKEVGSAKMQKRGDRLMATGLDVEPAHRRAGIAEAMYDWLTDKYGKVVRSPYQTEGSRGLWDKNEASGSVVEPAHAQKVLDALKAAEVEVQDGGQPFVVTVKGGKKTVDVARIDGDHVVLANGSRVRAEDINSIQDEQGQPHYIQDVDMEMSRRKAAGQLEGYTPKELSDMRDRLEGKERFSAKTRGQDEKPDMTEDERNQQEDDEDPRPSVWSEKPKSKGLKETLPDTLAGPAAGTGRLGTGPGGKGIGQHDIIETIKRDFDMPVYPGAEAARYNLRNESVDLPDMRAGEAPLLTHELAHHLAKTGKIDLDPSKLPQDVVRGFQQFDYQSGRANVPEAMQEGFAEWLRMRSTDSLPKMSPEQEAAAKYAEKAIAEFKRPLDKLKGLFGQYEKQTPLQKFAGTISQTGKQAQPIITPGEAAADYAAKAWEATQTALLDDLTPTKRAEAEAMRRGMKFQPGTKLSEVAAVNRLSSVPLANDFQQGGMNKIVGGKQVQTGRPLAEIIKGVDIDTQENVLMPFMKAREQLFQATLAGGGKNIPVHELDMAEAAVKEFRGRPDAAQLEKVADAISREIFDAGLDSMVADGRVSQKLAAKWQRENPFYTSTKRVLGEDFESPDHGKPGTGSRDFMKGRTGETGEQTISLTQAIQERYLTVARVRNSQAKFNALMELAKAEGVGEWISPGKRGPNGEVLGVEKSEKHPQITGYVNGEAIHIPVNSKPFYEMYMGTQGEGTITHSALKGLGDIMQWTRIPQTIRGGGAALSWLYHMMSPIRDPIVAMQRTVRDGNTFENLADLGKWWGKSFSWYWRAMLAGGSGKVDIKQASDRMFAWMEQKAGREMDVGAQSGQKTFASRAMDGWHGFYQRLTDLLGAGERGTRVWEAKNVLEKDFGLTPEKLDAQLKLDPTMRDPVPYAAMIRALDIASQITHNTHQMGSSIRQLNRAWPFLGAHIAGTYKDVANAIAQPGKAAAGLAILGMAKATEWLIFKDDKRYKELAPYLRTGFVFDTPLGMIHLPAPRGLNGVIVGMMGEAMRWMSDSDPRFGEMMAHSLEEIAPHGGPEPVTTGVHMAANRSWTGRPIIPDREADRMSMGERMRDPRALGYAAQQLSGGMLSQRRLSVNPFRMDQNPHQSVTDYYDALHSMETQRAPYVRDGKSFPDEAKYQRLQYVSHAMGQLDAAIKGERTVKGRTYKSEPPTPEQITQYRQTQIDLAKRAMGQ